jgi:hypothetical protein
MGVIIQFYINRKKLTLHALETLIITYFIIYYNHNIISKINKCLSNDGDEWVIHKPFAFYRPGSNGVDESTTSNRYMFSLN